MDLSGTEPFFFSRVVATADADKNDPSTIDVAAFNVRIFGRTKASNSFVMGKLVKVTFNCH